MPCSIPTPRVASPQSKHYHMRCLMAFAAPAEHDVRGLRENFEPNLGWRSAIGVAHACLVSRKVISRTTIKWSRALVMKMRVGAVASIYKVSKINCHGPISFYPSNSAASLNYTANPNGYSTGHRHKSTYPLELTDHILPFHPGHTTSIHCSSQQTSSPNASYTATFATSQPSLRRAM